MTDRPIAEEDLHAYVDGRLDSQRAETVQTYLAAHPDTAAIVAAYGVDRQTMREALQPIADRPIPASLDVRRIVESRQGRSSAWGRSAAWGPAIAASIALLVGLGGGWLGRGAMSPAQNGISALAQEAADNYRVYAYDANRPVEISAADEPKLVRWVSNRLQRPVTPPSLSSAGFRLIGGRLVTTPHGPAAMFLYDGANGERLAVMIRRMTIDKQTRMSEHGDDGLGGVAWADKGMGYSLVGPASAHALHPLADEVRREVNSQI